MYKIIAVRGGQSAKIQKNTFLQTIKAGLIVYYVTTKAVLIMFNQNSFLLRL
jgi:hypothetical protein